jgi:integrase
MSGVSCLYRRPSGIYVVRLVVPVRLRRSVGRGEIHVSTRLRDWNAAKLVALKIQAQWRETFMVLAVEKLTIASPFLHGEGLISVCQAANAIGLADKSLLGELLNERMSIFTYAQNWQGLRVVDWSVIEIDHDDRFVLNSVEKHGERQVLSCVVRAFGPCAVISSLLSEGKANVSIFHLNGETSFWADEEIVIPLSAWMVQKGDVDRIRVRLSGGLLPEYMNAAKAPSKRLSEGNVVIDAVIARQSGKRFSELFAMYRTHQKWTDPHSKRMEAEASMFAELMDDPQLSDIGVESVHQYAALLALLPTDVYQARRKHPQSSLRRLIEIAEKDSMPRKNDSTVRDHVGRLGQVFAYGVSPGSMMHVNPADKFKRSWGASIQGRAQDDRDEFTPTELALIFSQNWFEIGAGEFTQKGSTNWRPHYFWLPLLALVTGGRLNELAQLYLNDVRQSEMDSNVWYLDFNLNQPDKVNADDVSDKSLKTVNAIRVVPLHNAVIEAGLPEYIAELRERGHHRLFPELKRDDDKGYGKPAGSWFNQRFLGGHLKIERNGKKTFHSLRHNFATAIERLDIPERVMAQLMGHAKGTTQVVTRYAKDRNAIELKSVIDRLVFPALNNLGHFNMQSAFKAIKHAERMKIANARGKNLAEKLRGTKI